MRTLSLFLTVCCCLTLLSSSSIPALAGSVGGGVGASPGSVAAVGVGAMSSGGVNGVGGGGGYPGARMNHPGPSVIWYPPEYSTTKQPRTACLRAYQRAKATNSRYRRSRYNNCIK
jgi:hypothetical protein